MKRRNIQYTIRGVSDRLDRLVRERAAEYGMSLNSAAVTILSRGAGLDDQGVQHHDLDDLAGTWVQDDQCDKVLAEMDRIDPEIWK